MDTIKMDIRIMYLPHWIIRCKTIFNWMKLKKVSPVKFKALQLIELQWWLTINLKFKTQAKTKQTMILLKILMILNEIMEVNSLESPH